MLKPQLAADAFPAILGPGLGREPPLFVPPFPPRSRDWAPIWSAFVGKRANNSVYGWPHEAFSSFWKT